MTLERWKAMLDGDGEENGERSSGSIACGRVLCRAFAPGNIHRYAAAKVTRKGFKTEPFLL